MTNERVDLAPVLDQLPVQRDQAGEGRSAPLVGEREIELHRRDVIGQAGEYFSVCSCGYMSRARRRLADAMLAVCEVEWLLAESAERRRRLKGQERLA